MAADLTMQNMSIFKCIKIDLFHEAHILTIGLTIKYSYMTNIVFMESLKMNGRTLKE